MKHYEFSTPVIESFNGFDSITMPGARSFGSPGEPVMPMFGAQILLPPGETISRVEIIPGEIVVLSGQYQIRPGQMQSPLSSNEVVSWHEPSTEIYQSSSPYPGKDHDEPLINLFRGYQVASFALHPCEYIPATGQISYMRSCDVQITTRPDVDQLSAISRMIRHDLATITRLNNIIDNPSDVAAYSSIVRDDPKSRNLDPALDYTYLIITTESWYDGFAPLADYLTKRGHKTGVFLKSWILANYTDGVDDQDDIRDFVIDAYETWQIDYLLLGGDAMDANGIPHRGLYSNTDYGETDSDIPADMYYGCLDGNWNSDGDSRWGEPEEADMLHEVAVGRACVSSQNDVVNFVTKAIRYTAEPVVSECDEALMAGELLWNDPTWGGDYKDEIKFGSSSHGYTTAGFPATMNVDTMYDRDATWAPGSLISDMENGINIVNHLGHCNVDYAMKLYVSDVASFDNDGIEHTYNFVYSQGCYGGSFDNRNTSGGYQADCIGEEFQTDDAGAVALVFNSRYGWGQHLSTDGSSQYFDREFFDAMFSEEIYTIGEANDDSKMDVLWHINYGANRYCYYELNVFGDPSMHLWTAEPSALDLSYPSAIQPGVPDMDLTVRDDGGYAVANARVTIYTNDGSVYDTGLTNGAGEVTLHPNAENVGTLYIVATAHDHLMFEGNVPILPPVGPYLVYNDCCIYDSGLYADGAFDAGETVGFAISIENVGVEVATGIIATVSSANPAVEILTEYLVYDDIPAGEIGTNALMLEVRLAGDVPDQTPLLFDIHITASGESWDGGFAVIAEAPVLISKNLFINDYSGGSGNGAADPGETFELSLWLANTGHMGAYALTGSLISTDPNVVIHQDGAYCTRVLVGEDALMSRFTVAISSDCPTGIAIPFQVLIENDLGMTATLEIAIGIGNFVDDVESDNGWTLGLSSDSATTGQWERADPVGTADGAEQAQPEDDHTPDPGSICFVTSNGPVGGDIGEADVDGGHTTLLSPVFYLGGKETATVEYWRWYSNNLGTNTDDTWKVEVTDDGDNWVFLENTAANANWWSRHEYNLTDYIELTNQVQIRFIATDDGGGSIVEAAVDDFMLLATGTPLADTEDNSDSLPGGIISCGVSPLHSNTIISFRLPDPTTARLDLYDVSGRRVQSLLHKEMSAGIHSVNFAVADDPALSSGIYFLKLETPELMQVKQITILK